MDDPLINETLPNFIERKHPRKGEKGNKGQGLKTRQANNPTKGATRRKGNHEKLNISPIA
jgi:hypothetical protein